MGEIRIPELNSVLILGNLTKDPIYRKTIHNTPVANFAIAVNRKYKDSSNQWQENVCYIGVVAWNKLAESCIEKLKKGSTVLIDGELQNRDWKTEEGQHFSVVEIKARRIQFLSKNPKLIEQDGHIVESDIEDLDFEDDSLDKFFPDGEHRLVNKYHKVTSKKEFSD